MSAEHFRIGIAQVEITPERSIELSGFALRQQPSAGVLDPLFVRALRVQSAGVEFLWLHCDLLAVDEALVARFRRWARDKFGLEPAQVLLTATHTHSGPATVPLRAAGAPDVRYLEQLDEKLRSAAEMARMRSEECTLVSVEETFSLAVHRRGPATAHVDPRVAALGFKRRDGTFAAVVVNYAIHPVALGHSNRAVSADLPGAVALALSRQLPGQPVVLFANGACGNLNPPGENVAWTRVQEWGNQFAALLAPALQRARPVPATLRLARRLVPLPLEYLDRAALDAAVAATLATVPDEGFGRRVRECVHGWGDDLRRELAEGRAAHRRDAELHLVQIGDCVLAGVNAEVFSVFTDWLRRDTGLAKVYTLGYANGDMGYLCTRPAYAEGGYEVDMAHIFYGGYRFRIGALEQLADEAVAAIARLSVPKADFAAVP